MRELFNIFYSFFKIGLFTFGGGYSMIIMMQREISDKRKWLDSEEFLNYLSLAQSSPGPMAVNMAILIGYKQKNVIGGIFGFLGSTIPSYIVLLTMAIFFRNIYDNPYVISIFKGMRPAVVALILYPVFNFAKNVTKPEYLIFTAIGVGILFKISPLYFILCGIIYGVAFAYYKIRKEVKK